MALIRERADDRAWHHSVLDRLNIRRTGTEIARRGNGEDDARLQYALEWGFFTRCQWGEFDTALYELERCWGRKPESPAPIGAGGRPPTERSIRSLSDVHAAIAHYVNAIPYERILSTATHLSTDIDYRMVTDAEMEAALARRATAGSGRAGRLCQLHQRSIPHRNWNSGPTALSFSSVSGPSPCPMKPEAG